MKLTYCYLCQDCQEIFERAPGGRCLSCGSEAIASLSRLLQDPAKQTAWLRRIGRLRCVTRVIQPEENLTAFLTALE